MGLPGRTREDQSGTPAPDGPPDGPAASFAGALVLAGLAGWVDAIGLTRLGGTFLSFMSGNTTSFAAAALHGSRSALDLGLVIVLFVGGVVLGEFLCRTPGQDGRRLVLSAEAALLAAAALLAWAEGPVGAVSWLLALAMGTQNASIHRAGGISVSLTYVTGTLVHIGAAVARALRGAALAAAAPYVALWAALACGAGLGAAAASVSTPGALGAACACACAFAIRG
ncbi:MAG: DUF1275 domain-containing protein [Proteobacteria bacterium]|nr:DUF1275 domain-containing protein [Pseudomonadota bacterium]